MLLWTHHTRVRSIVRDLRNKCVTQKLLIDQARLKFSNTPGHDMNGLILHLPLVAHKIVHCTSQTHGKWVHSIFEAPLGTQRHAATIHPNPLSLGLECIAPRPPPTSGAQVALQAAEATRKHIPLPENFYFCL